MLCYAMLISLGDFELGKRKCIRGGVWRGGREGEE